MIAPKVLERTKGLHGVKGRVGDRDSGGRKKVVSNRKKIMTLKWSLFRQNSSLWTT